MAEQVDQVVHVFDEEHAAFASERQAMYPAHADCPPATYDWAKGVVCGCDSPLLGSNPPVGGKGEQMDYFTIPGKPTTGSRIETDEGFYEFDGKRWIKFGQELPQEAEPVKPVKGNFMDLNVTGSFSNMGQMPETDANHDFAEDMVAAYPHHNIHLGINTGFMALPETTAVRFLVQGNGIADWVKHFLTKQQDYGDWAGELGAKGQFADMYRKWPKIRKAMWDEEPLVGEQLDEVLMDLIGHCFLSLMFLRKERGEFK